MFKTLLRKSFRKAKQWLEEDQSHTISPITSIPKNANYKWMNTTLFPWLQSQSGRSFRSRYTWGVMHSAHLAKTLGIDRITVVEFGVAGGNGLIALEKVAEKLESIYAIRIDVFGFDTGVGLPKPEDYRDLPNLYSESTFRMDVKALEKRLQKAQLIIGLIKDTIVDFIQSKPAPIAFISIDVDLYSSSMHALQVLDMDQQFLLPRIHCYLDDIMGRSCCEFNGERLAVNDFNQAHEQRKIAPIYGLKYYLPEQFSKSIWSEKFFMAHIFDHALYGHSDKLARDNPLSLTDPGNKPALG